MILKVGTVCVANSFNEMLFGCIVKTSPYSSGDSFQSYKIEWSDGFTEWYRYEETLGYARKAVTVVNDP